MNYIYDILLNFNRKLYDFFDWDINDNIIHIRKIPVYRTDSKTLLDFRDFHIKVDHNFLNQIQNCTEIFTSKDIGVMEYAILLTDGSSVLAFKFAPDGNILGKSFLLVDEDEEVLDISKKLEECTIDYEVLKQDVYVPLKSRKEQKMEKFVSEELRKSKKEQAFEKLEYLYFECFGKWEESVDKILNHFQNQMKKGNYEMTEKLYDFFKLTSALK